MRSSIVALIVLPVLLVAGCGSSSGSDPTLAEVAAALKQSGLGPFTQEPCDAEAAVSQCVTFVGPSPSGGKETLDYDYISYRLFKPDNDQLIEDTISLRSKAGIKVIRKGKVLLQPNGPNASALADKLESL